MWHTNHSIIRHIICCQRWIKLKNEAKMASNKFVYTLPIWYHKMMQKAALLIKNSLKPTFSIKSRRLMLGLGFVFFILFSIFTFIVREDLLRKFDFDTTVRLQDNIPVRFDEVFSFFSVIGRFEFSIIMLILILLFYKKLTGFIVIGLFGLAHLVELIGKTILSQPGPPHMFLRTTNLSFNFPGLHIHTDASYPSGHSLRVVFLLILLVLLVWKNKKIPAFLKYLIAGISGSYTFLMLLSRVSLGEHWTTDVVGGVLLGISFAFFSLLLL